MAVTFLCIASYYKGSQFISEAHKAGHKVYLITSGKWMHKPWPKDQIEDIFYLDADKDNHWNTDYLLSGIAYLMQTTKIDHVIPLDEYDLEIAALIRETFRLPGMGQTTARYFRDKLAMRMRAQNAKIKVPGFSSLFNNEDIAKWLHASEGPWIIKPRSFGGTIGMTKCNTPEEVWNKILKLGNERKDYLIERYIEGDVYHADSLCFNGKVLFTLVSKYLAPPYEVIHDGGIFRSVVIPYDSSEEKAISKLNEKVLHAFGMQHSTAHTEFIFANDGTIYFLETAARVAGANISELIKAASGLDFWKEWVSIESKINEKKNYKLPKTSKLYSGIITSLSKQQKPDYSFMDDAEVVWRLDYDYHIGGVFRAESHQRILDLHDKYAVYIQNNLLSSASPLEKRAE